MNLLRSMDPDKAKTMIFVYIKYYALSEQEHYDSYALKHIIQAMSRGTQIGDLLNQEYKLCHEIRWAPKFPEFHE